MAAKAPTRRRQRDVVQVKNPRSGRYVKIDRTAGMIVAHKKSPGPYTGVPIARTRKNKMITGDDRFRASARALLKEEGLDARAKTSVERLAVAF